MPTVGRRTSHSTRVRGWLAALLCAVSAPATAAQVWSFLGTVMVVGQIEAGDQHKLEATFRKFDAPAPLSVASPGGHLGTALDMAPIIRQRAAKLRLTGPCVSACASVLLASHPVREARKTAVVAFHATDAVWMTQALAEMRRLAAQDPAFATLVGDLMHRSEIEFAALDERLRGGMRLAGMNVAMFDRASHATRQRLTHFSYDPTERQLDLDKAPATTCSFWVPDEPELAAMGVVFNGGYRRLPPDELARILNVPRSELLLHLDDADTQCVDRPVAGHPPSVPGKDFPAHEPGAGPP